MSPNAKEVFDLIKKRTNYSASKVEEVAKLGTDTLRTAISRKSILKHETADKLITAFPFLSRSYIMMGEGAPYVDLEMSTPAPGEGDSYKEKYIALLEKYASIQEKLSSMEAKNNDTIKAIVTKNSKKVDSLSLNDQVLIAVLTSALGELIKSKDKAREIVNNIVREVHEGVVRARN